MYSACAPYEKSRNHCISSVIESHARCIRGSLSLSFSLSHTHTHTQLMWFSWLVHLGIFSLSGFYLITPDYAGFFLRFLRCSSGWGKEGTLLKPWKFLHNSCGGKKKVLVTNKHSHFRENDGPSETCVWQKKWWRTAFVVRTWFWYNNILKKTSQTV